MWNYMMYDHNPKTPWRPSIHISIISQILGIQFCYHTLETFNKLLVKGKLNHWLWIYIDMYSIIKSCFWPLSSPRVAVEGWIMILQNVIFTSNCVWWNVICTQTQNPRGRGLCRMFWTFDRTWKKPWPAWEGCSSAIGGARKTRTHFKKHED